MLLVVAVVIGADSGCNGALTASVAVDGLGTSGNKREEYSGTFWGLSSDLREEEDEEGGGGGRR